MTGKVYISTTPYYDTKTKQQRLKQRPVLVVGGPRNNDYTVLPISTISIRTNVDPEYDILLDAPERAILSLKKECFVRTHKQTPIHQAELHKEIGDMKKDLPDLYLQVMVKMEQFQKELLGQVI